MIVRSSTLVTEYILRLVFSSGSPLACAAAACSAESRTRVRLIAETARRLAVPRGRGEG